MNRITDTVTEQLDAGLLSPAHAKAYVLKVLFMACEGHSYKEGFFNSDLLMAGMAWTMEEILQTMEQADKYIEELQAKVKAAGGAA